MFNAPMGRARDHLRWDAEQLWLQLQPLLPDLSVEVLAHTDSTNAQLIERARISGGRRDEPVTVPGQLDVRSRDGDTTPLGRRTGDTSPCLLVAETQTRGRGRQGKVWHSSPAASLTFSLALPLAPADWSGLSLAVGVALAQALDAGLPPGSQPPIGLKWPNDLWFVDAPGVGRKLGGTLIETVAVGPRRMAVIGVGLNVLPLSLRDLSTGYACLHERDAAISAPRALHMVALPLVQALLRFERDGLAPFAAAFAERDLLRGHAVVTSLPQLPGGVADGIDARGALRLLTPDTPGGVELLTGGEVSVRSASMQPPAPEAD